MKISDSVRAAMVPDDKPMHPDFTSIYLVGPEKGQSLTIDSGEALDHYRWFLRGYLAASERAEIGIAAITHHHSDHSGNLKWVKEHLKADVAIPAGGRPLLKGLIPPQVDTLEDGDTIELGKGVRVQVLHTPGHSIDSLCYYLEDEGVLFTGDTLLGSSTTTVWNLAAYRKSLQRLVDLPNLNVICPGHGKIVNDPRERLQMYIDHRDLRERQILSTLKDSGPITSWDIMLRLYPDIAPGLRRGADNNVRRHLEQLEAEGALTVHPGKPRRGKTAAQQARDVEHAHEHDRILKQARRIEDQRRRAERRAQENPPDENWATPPRYELR
ncbi:MAG: MBL fold metallo-hydrolase [Dehalococcoidia bacterium]|nr:MBL fold metallo-hydrolase [Dehalococcoidia bacterium]